jgi:hypothetical protein
MAEFTDPFEVLDTAQARRKRLVEQESILAQMGQSQRGYAQQYADLIKQYQRGMSPRVSSFAQRGLGSSGIFQRAMKEYAANQQQQLGNLAMNQASEEDALRLQEQQSAQELQEFLDRQNIRKQQEIAAAAASLKDWQPFTGLYS